jgi:hypothetical protein
MLCKNVLPLLSEFYDDVLNADISVQISQHLDQCSGCRKEFENLSLLQNKLKSLKGIQAPEFLGSLVQHRIAEIQRNSWRKNLQNTLERRWSKIRTTEGTWYITKALGTVMTSLFLVLICGNYFPSTLMETSMQRDIFTQNDRKQVGQDFMRKLGMQPPPKIRVAKTDAAINEAYLNDIGKKNARPGKDDNLCVWAKIDSIGSAEIEVLERPKDRNLLNNVYEGVTKAHYRPGSENGKAVPSNIILIFNILTVNGRMPEVE